MPATIEDDRYSAARILRSPSKHTAKIDRIRASFAKATPNPSKWLAHRQYHQSGRSEAKNRNQAARICPCADAGELDTVHVSLLPMRQQAPHSDADRPSAAASARANSHCWRSAPPFAQEAPGGIRINLIVEKGDLHNRIPCRHRPCNQDDRVPELPGRCRFREY